VLRFQWDLCTNPEMACEVTLAGHWSGSAGCGDPVSDILTIPDAMGLGACYLELGGKAHAFANGRYAPPITRR